MSDLLNTNDTDFEFDPDAVDSIDQSSLEGRGPSYPLIQWVKGDLKAKKFGGMDYQGGLFIKASKVEGIAMEAAGWTKTTRTFENGTEEEGFWRREAAMIIIAERKCWEGGSNGDLKSFPHNSKGWEAAKAANGGKKARGHAQYLVLVKGLESAGLFSLTMKGAALAAFDSSRSDSVVSRFVATILSAANARSVASAKAKGKEPKYWAYRGFYLPFGAARDAKGEPVYTAVGTAPDTTNVVLPVALGLPDKADQVDTKTLGRFYVGDDMLKHANLLFDESVDWRAAWGNGKPSGAVEGGDAAAVEERAAKDAEDAVLAATGL